MAAYSTAATRCWAAKIEVAKVAKFAEPTAHLLFQKVSLDLINMFRHRVPSRDPVRELQFLIADFSAVFILMSSKHGALLACHARPWQ